LRDVIIVVLFFSCALVLLGSLNFASGASSTPTILEITSPNQFGHSIATNGNLVIVGDIFAGSTGQGSATLFDLDGNIVRTYENPSLLTGEQFGRQVAMDGNLILISDPWDDLGEVDSGIVYLYDTDGNLLQTFINPNPASIGQDFFGHGLSISGNLILIGATEPNAVGTVYLYDTDGNLLKTFNHPTPEIGINFGHDVSISGNLVLIGTPGDNTDAENTGIVFLFDTDGNLLHTIHNPTPELNDLFGNAVFIDGDRIVIAARQTNTGAGEAYVYDTDGNLLHTLPNPNPDSQDRFGFDIA